MRARGISTRIVVAAGLAIAVSACADDGDGDSAGSVDAWCGLMEEANEVDRALSGAATASPGELETALTRAVEVVALLEPAAPPEIADDVATIGDSTRRLATALEAADYSLFDADLSAVSDPAQEARIDEAQANLDAFSMRECGQPFGETDSQIETDEPPATDGGFDLGAGTIREQLETYFLSIGLTAAEAECVAAQADPTDSALLAGDTDAILALFQECGIPLERLAELGG